MWMRRTIKYSGYYLYNPSRLIYVQNRLSVLGATIILVRIEHMYFKTICAINIITLILYIYTNLSPVWVTNHHSDSLFDGILMFIFTVIPMYA